MGGYTLNHLLTHSTSRDRGYRCRYNALPHFVSEQTKRIGLTNSFVHLELGTDKWEWICAVVCGLPAKTYCQPKGV